MEKEARTAETANALFIEQRADGKEYIVLKAITFNTWSKPLGGYFKERISPRALDGCDMSNVLNKFNHSMTRVIGRTPDTLQLEVREDGLYAYTEYDPQDADHVYVRRKIEKKIVRGSSFEFSIGEKGSIWSTEVGSNYELRDVIKIARLYDVAPVIDPAYEDTNATLSARSLDSIRAERDEFVSEQRTQNEEPDPATTDTTPTNADDASQSVAAEHDRLAMEMTM